MSSPQYNLEMRRFRDNRLENQPFLLFACEDAAATAISDNT